MDRLKKCPRLSIDLHRSVMVPLIHVDISRKRTIDKDGRRNSPFILLHFEVAGSQYFLLY
jgi:hypothetical protein